MTADYCTGSDCWKPERNPLAGPDAHYCPTCSGNVRDRVAGLDVIRECPVCPSEPPC